MKDKDTYFLQKPIIFEKVGLHKFSTFIEKMSQLINIRSNKYFPYLPKICQVSPQQFVLLNYSTFNYAKSTHKISTFACWILLSVANCCSWNKSFFSAPTQFPDASKRSTGKRTKLFDPPITDIWNQIILSWWAKSILEISPMSPKPLRGIFLVMPTQIQLIIWSDQENYPFFNPPYSAGNSSAWTR